MQKKFNMKTRVILASLFLSMALFSCKKEVKTEAAEAIVVDETKDLFKVSLDLVVKKNDTLHLYYTEDGSINFSEESSIWLPVTGKEANQEVTFMLPKDVFPTQFRLDLGVNQAQEDIVFKTISFNYLDKKFASTGADVANYFIPDQSKCSFDIATGTIKATKDNGTRLSPSFYPNELRIKAELEKLAK